MADRPPHDDAERRIPVWFREWLASDDPKARSLRDHDPWGWLRWWLPEAGVREMLLEGLERAESVAAVPGGWEGWACHEPLDLLELLLERSRRRSEGRWPEDDEQHLRALRLERMSKRYVRNRQRQRVVCEALGWPWPPDTKKPRWNWCWEGGRLVRPVVYPPDWLPEVEPDAYGQGDRWVAGEVLLLDEDEVSAIAAKQPAIAATPPPGDPSRAEPAPKYTVLDPATARSVTPFRRLL